MLALAALQAGNPSGGLPGDFAAVELALVLVGLTALLGGVVRGTRAGLRGMAAASLALVGVVLVTWMSGKLTKMNTTAVFVALLFWGWLWGVWGLLFAIPIMGMLKVFAERIEDLQPLAE